ncbi:MAG: hypothetical protein IJN80_04915 [Clostridia bacterium]|nr:hypothetical protein [Clostridia bacterium]
MKVTMEIAAPPEGNNNIAAVASTFNALADQLPKIAYDLIGLNLDRAQVSETQIIQIAKAFRSAACVFEIKLLG